MEWQEIIGKARKEVTEASADLEAARSAMETIYEIANRGTPHPDDVAAVGEIMDNLELWLLEGPSYKLDRQVQKLAHYIDMEAEGEFPDSIFEPA